MGVCAPARGRCISGLYIPCGILIPRQDGSRHLQEQASWGQFLSDQLQRRCTKRTATAQDKQGRDGHRCQGRPPITRDILPMAGLVTHSPRAQLQPLAHTDSGTGALLYNCSTYPSPPRHCLCSCSLGCMLHTPDPLLNAQNCRHSMNNWLRSAVAGTFPARAPEVASTTESHQRNFQK